MCLIQTTNNNCLSQYSFINDSVFTSYILYTGLLIYPNRKIQVQHDKDLPKFMEATKKRTWPLMNCKCVFFTGTLRILGSRVSKGEIKPDPESLKHLQDLPLPVNLKSQKRVVGLLPYYSQWIKDFSKKIRPLILNTTFPLPVEAQRSFDLRTI